MRSKEKTLTLEERKHKLEIGRKRKARKRDNDMKAFANTEKGGERA